MKKVIILSMFLILFVAYMGFANVLIVDDRGIKAKVSLLQEDLDFLSKVVLYSLNDLGDVLPYSYIDVDSAQLWVNSVIDIINSTNTNVVLVKGKPSVPKKLPSLQIKTIDAKSMSSISKIVSDIKGALVVSYSPSKSGIKIDLQYLDQSGKVISKRSLDIPFSNVRDKDTVILLVKESIVEVLSGWRYYYYDPKRNGTVNISVKPTVKNVSIVVKPDNIPLSLGKNVLGEGEYTLIISASGFQPIITNIYVKADSTVNLVFSLQKPLSIESPVPMGMIYLDANVKGVPVIIAEGNVFGTTPMFTNLTEGIKNVIFQQTPNTLLKSVQIEVKPNDINYYFVNLERIGAGVNIVADNGSFVVINRRLEGIITTGSYYKNLSRGIHTITVFKHGFEVFRTNVNIVSDEKLTLNVKLTPKKVPVFVVTPSTKEAVVSLMGKNISTTPCSVRLDSGKESTIDIVAQDVGFNNVSVNFLPSMFRINTLVLNLSPLYGDLLVLTDPIDALVKIDGRVVGKTGLDGLLLRSISARKSFIFVQKEGYKAVKTNMYILPNIQNSLSLKLKEAPIKLFVNTLPVQNVGVYFSDEYYGDNDGVINVELGNFVMKLIKRGFKTLYTNVSFTDKVDTVIPMTFQMVPGASEVEIIESVNNSIVEFDRLLSNESYLDAYEVIKKSKDDILSSGYTNYSLEILKLYNFLNKKEMDIKPKVEFYVFNNEANNVLMKSEEFVRIGSYSEALNVIRDFVKKLNSSSLTDDGKTQILSKVSDKYRMIAILSVSNKVSNDLVQAEKFIAKGEKSAAFSVYEDIVKFIDESIVEFGDVKDELLKIRDSVLSNFIPLGIEVISNKVSIVLISVKDLEDKKNYTNAIDLVSSALKEIRFSKIYFLEEVKNFESILKDKYEYLVNKSIEEEQIGEVKAIYDEIKPILKEAVRLASIEEYDSAIKKYREAIKIIEISEFKENPFLVKLKDSIMNDIIKLEQEKKAREELKAKSIKIQEEIEKKKKELPWWVRMQKAWTGVGLEIGSSVIVPSGNDFYVTNMNINVFGKLHISFLPILGFSIGGFYNANSQIVYSNSAYLYWMGLGQVSLRIPIVKQISIFGAFGSGIGQSVIEPLKLRMGQDYLLNTGIDLKFSWFGIRLSYDMAFYDNFASSQIGGGFGIILWATED
ncbi:MAG: PEGA domain-containing protein [Brevinematia bacterium]